MDTGVLKNAVLRTVFRDVIEPVLHSAADKDVAMLDVLTDDQPPLLVEASQFSEHYGVTIRRITSNSTGGLDHSRWPPVYHRSRRHPIAVRKSRPEIFPRSFPRKVGP